MTESKKFQTLLHITKWNVEMLEEMNSSRNGNNKILFTIDFTMQTVLLDL